MFLPLKKIRRAPWQADGAFESHILNEVLLKKVCAILGVSRSNWNLEMFFFGGEGKTEVPGEKPLGAKARTKNKLNRHMTPSPGNRTRATLVEGE